MSNLNTTHVTDAYTVTRRRHPHGHEVMVITPRDTPEAAAEYRLTPGREQQQLAAMRRLLDEHMMSPGGTLGDWQWHWECFGV